MIRRPITILVLLTGLNLLNYLDRLVLPSVLPRVQDELGLSNFLAGSLATIFLIGYFSTSPLFGWLGDRRRRTGLIAFGIFVWSAATFASGLAKTAEQLIVARALVGVGEASYITLAPTIIDDIAPPARKASWLAIFHMASPVGGALGYLVGGYVEHHYGWRAAFFVAGGPGVVLAALCLLIAEPARQLSEKHDIVRSLKTLWHARQYRIAVLGYSAFTFAVGGFSFWAPSFVYRQYGLPLNRANFLFGVITVVGGALGTILGGAWADRLLRRTSTLPEHARDEAASRDLLKVCAWGSAAAAPLAVICFLAPQSSIFFGAILLCEIGLFLSTSPINALMLRTVPTELRASAMAICVFAIHMFGDLWSPPVVGLLADHAPLRIAMMALPLAIAISAWTWWPRRTQG